MGGKYNKVLAAGFHN